MELDDKIAETAEATEQTDVDTVGIGAEQEDTAVDDSAEIAKLKAELARAKAATTKATSEAAAMKKQLRARQTAEEAAAEEKREADAALQAELTELRKRFSVAETAKDVLSFIKSEEAANAVAEHLYGAEDANAALALIKKEWAAREKALKLEYGKIPAPGVGGTDGPTITKADLDKMSYTDRAKFLLEHPEEYRKLMGR